MGLRCSLLGHDFGDIVVERDRDERGEEIVVTERELRECARCGAETVVSENTEVRRRRPDEGGAEATPAEDETGSPGAPSIADAESAMEADADQSAAADAPDAASLVEEAEASTADSEGETEDAVILDAEEAAESTADTEPAPESPTDEAPTDEATTDETATDETAPTEDAADGVVPEESGETEILEDEPAESEPAAEPADANPMAEEPTDAEPVADEPAEPDAPATDADVAGAAPQSSESDEPARSTTDDVASVDPDEEAEVLSGSTTAEASGERETAVDEPSAKDSATTPPGGEAGDATGADSATEDAPDDAVSGDSAFEFAGAGAERSEAETEAEAAESAPAQNEPADATPSDPSSGIASKGPIDLTGPTDSGVDGILVCPACDFTVPIARSSNRAGDICPECHKGYLAEER
jgi:hypothetical protein